MQPHAHADRPAGKCALAVGGGGNGVRRAGEGDEEGITLRVDLDAVVLGKRRAESPPVLVQRLPVAVAELLQQPRRTLHIREQQRHHTGRERAHHRRGSCADVRSLSSESDTPPYDGSEHVAHPRMITNRASRRLRRHSGTLAHASTQPANACCGHDG